MLLNIFYNFIGSILPIAFLQLVIYPFLGKMYSSEDYGKIITAVSFCSIIATGLGVSLNNVRLLTAEKYKNGRYYDFKIIICFYQIINILCVSCYGIYLKMEISECICYLLFSCILLMKDYLIVLYLIELNYKKVCIYNSLTVVGYLIGIVFHYYIHNWICIWIFANIVPVCYIWIFDKKLLCGVGKVKSDNFRATIKKACAMSGAALLNQFIAYADRMILYPLLGGTSVAIYYVSSLISKVFSLCMGPVQGVFLSYISRGNLNERLNFNITLKYGLISGICIYFCCRLFSEDILLFLYPNLVESAMKYIDIVTITSINYCINSLLMPFIMKECDEKWTFRLALENVIIYVILGYFSILYWGLLGFCYASAATNVYRSIRMYLIYRVHRNNYIAIK